MFVTVRLFARLREIARSGELQMELADDATVSDAWRALTVRHEGFTPYAASVSCAVNADYSKMSAPLADGDEVAFLPPVSGDECSGFGIRIRDSDSIRIRDSGFA